jgi:hypothetical protein
MAAPGTTVCVIPRERFSAAVAALEALLDDPALPDRVVYFDGGSPPKVRDELERLARGHDITLIRSDAYAVPNVARNWVLPRVDTEFTAFIDNDVFVTKGWVPRLEATAPRNRRLIGRYVAVEWPSPSSGDGWPDRLADSDRCSAGR